MNLFGVMETSGEAMQAERMRAEVVAANMANAETTRTASGGPYHRQHVVFAADRGDAGFLNSMAAASSADSGTGLSSSLDLADGRGADRGAALPGPGRCGEQLRRVEEPVGVGRLHDTRPAALPDHGADHRLGLQLVDDLHAVGNPGQTRRSHHLAAAGPAWHRPPNPSRESDH